MEETQLGDPPALVGDEEYVEFWPAGTVAKGQFSCAACGNQVTVHQVLPRCMVCGAAGPIATTIVPDESTSSTATPVRPLVLPDPTITPGGLNRMVRQSTIKKTICKSGWTKTIRPPVGFTNALKIRQMMMYGETG